MKNMTTTMTNRKMMIETGRTVGCVSPGVNAYAGEPGSA